MTKEYVGPDCEHCLDTGYVCDICDLADGSCICGGESADLQQFVPCEDCDSDFD